MSGFEDDALHDMLTARADRVSPIAAGEVMVGVRAEVRGPRQGAAFSVLPVLTGRSPAFGAGWAAAIMVAVLVMVVVATRPATVAPSASAGAGTSVAAPSGVLSPPSASLPAGISLRDAVALAAKHVETVSTDPTAAVYDSKVGTFADVAPADIVGIAPSIPPTQLVWAVTFLTVTHTTVFLDYATGAYLGAVDTVPGRLSTADLNRVITNRSLDGRLVLVDSTLLELAGAPCTPDPCLAQYQLQFVGPVITQPAAGQPVVPARPADGSAPLTGTFVVVPWQGHLILVGRLEGSLASPVMPSSMTDTYQPPDPGGAIALQAIAGVLDQDVAVPCTPGGDCSPPAITWTYASPEPNGAAGGARFVTLDTPALGIDPAVRKIAGPLLIRAGTGRRPEVVARYDVGSYWTVATPTVTCDLPATTTLPSCDRLVIFATESLPNLGDLSSVDVRQGTWACPASMRTCSSVPPEQSALVTVRSSSGDWQVGLSFDARGIGLDLALMPLKKSYPVPSSATVTCSLDTSAIMPPCNEVVAEALVSLGTNAVGMIGSVEVSQGAYCPTGTACPTVEPDRANVIVRGTYGDWVVNLGYGPDGRLVSTESKPLPAPDPSASSVPTSCVEGGYGQVTSLTCQPAVAAALAVVPAGTSIVSVEFAYGSAICPPWVRCVLASMDPNAGYVIVHVSAPGPDLWVGVTADTTGLVTAGSPVRYPFASTSVSPAPTYAVSIASSAPWAMCQITVNAPASAIDCNAAIAAALSVLPAGTTVVSAEFAPGSCPPWARCGAVLDRPATAHVTVKVAPPGPDLWVSVTLGSNGIVTASAPIPFPAGWPSPSPAP